MKIEVKVLTRDEPDEYVAANPSRSLGVIKRNWDRYPDFYEYLLIDGANVDHDTFDAFMLIIGVKISELPY